jgi:hypothetical protein
MGIMVCNRACKKRKKGRVDIMIVINYKNYYSRIKEEMADPEVSVDMKRALLELEIGLRKVELQEMKECIERGIDNEDNRSD